MELSSRRRTRRTSGFTLIEALVAAGIILIVAVGILPLFIRAMSNNVAGADSTFVSNAAKSGVESYLDLPFNHALMTIPAGATSIVATDTYTQGANNQIGETTEGWGGTAGLALWTRTITVRQYNVTSDLDGGSGQKDVFDEPESGSTDSAFVHLKEIEVSLASSRVSGPLTGKTITLRLLRAE